MRAALGQPGGELGAVRHEHQHARLRAVQLEDQVGDVPRRVGSRLPVGSSHSKRCGRITSARASAVRWRSPPDSSPGRCERRSPRPTRSSSAARPRRVVVGRGRDQRRGQHVLEHAQLGQQEVVLEHEADLAVAEGRELALRERVDVTPFDEHASRARPLERPEDVEQRALAAAGRTDDARATRRPRAPATRPRAPAAGRAACRRPSRRLDLQHQAASERGLRLGADLERALRHARGRVVAPRAFAAAQPELAAARGIASELEQLRGQVAHVPGREQHAAAGLLDQLRETPRAAARPPALRSRAPRAGRAPSAPRTGSGPRARRGPGGTRACAAGRSSRGSGTRCRGPTAASAFVTPSR